jgi:zinc protease
LVVTAGPTVTQQELPPPSDKPAELPSAVPH